MLVECFRITVVELRALAESDRTFLVKKDFMPFVSFRVVVPDIMDSEKRLPAAHRRTRPVLR